MRLIENGARSSPMTKSQRGHKRAIYLKAKAVEGHALLLEGIDDVYGSHLRAKCILLEGNAIADDVLEKVPEGTAGFVVHKTRDALDAGATGKAADGGLSDTLDVAAKDLAVTLGANNLLSSCVLSYFATPRHCLAVIMVAAVQLYWRRLCCCDFADNTFISLTCSQIASNCGWRV